MVWLATKKVTCAEAALPRHMNFNVFAIGSSKKISRALAECHAAAVLVP
jgi:hypothetical protein